MKRLLIQISFFSIFLLCWSLFAQNSLRAQLSMDQMGQAESRPPLMEQLQELSLPGEPIADGDVPRIETVIKEVLNKINENEMPTKQNNADIQPMMSGMVVFKDWLTQQECVDEVIIPYVRDFEEIGEFTESVFDSYPGEIVSNIMFRTGEESTERYRLIIYISAADGLKFASIIKNNTPQQG